MPTFPFQRAKPLGWSLFEVLTSAQMSQVDANAAQAANGLVWTDVASLRNWSSPLVTAQAVLAFCYHQADDVWVGVGVNAGNPVAFQRGGGGGVWQAMTNPGSGAGLTIRGRAAAFKPTGTGGVMVFGGLPGSSSNQKYRVLSFGAWSTTNSSFTSTASVECIAWVSALGLFVAGLSDGGVETSPDGVTWTARTTPNANARSSIAVGPINGANGGVVISSSAAVNKVIRSVDGITWTEHTLPGVATNVRLNCVYVPNLGKYFALDGANIQSSTDGATWTTVTPSYPLVGGFQTGAQVVLAFDRTMVHVGTLPSGGTYGAQIGILYSLDGGLNWKIAATFPSGTVGGFATNGSQLHYYVASSGVVSSICSGF